MLNEGDLKKFIGKRIKEYRKKKGLTQKELGEKIGVGDTAVSAYERGIATPDYDNLFAVANILDIRVDDLFPPFQYDDDYLDDLKGMTEQKLEVEDLHFLQSLIEKTLSLEGNEREKFLDSIRFTVDYYERKNND